MAVRVLTNEEYAKLAAKLLNAEGRDIELRAAAIQLKQVHRLLCDGHKVEDLTPAEQSFAVVFKDAQLTKVFDDYGWEPGVEIDDAPAEKPPAPAKNGKKKEK